MYKGRTMFKIRKKKNVLNEKLDRINELLTKSKLEEISNIIGNKKQILIRNFLAGISKGVGIGIGFTIITAILIIILQQIVKLNIPIIGQFVSLFVAMYFHYYKNKEINGNICYIKANASLIKGIYMIGASAALMQCLLAVMMAGMNAILGLAQVDPAILIGSFGIYYKIQQIALFSAFGLSNTIISILSFKVNTDTCLIIFFPPMQYAFHHL